MDALFDLLGSFFPFIIVAVIAVTRIYALVQKAKRGSRQAPQDRSGSARQSETGFLAPSYLQHRLQSASSPRSAVTLEQGGLVAKSAAALKKDQKGEEEFSAWSLSVDDEPPLPVQKPVSNPKPVPVFQKSFSQPAPGPFFQKMPEVEAGSQASLTAAIPGAVELSAPGKRIKSLTPLQQGMVWAEILGPPKAL
ncbi:conserved hypothetical protein [Treponema primitia ZAS-2]|uniref:Uncharacterized protein n=1 Tax=Treponema primitia (strain ATCC BAA-887 / DSM 12427 / ZAS-2) TaxID=545694 RepID=F5YJD0_TREPZ|nr:hypothetical protein [Treponema primitia]AEF86705.1 conserved hypothetical protein [Treponema primitia ZAS-2]